VSEDLRADLNPALLNTVDLLELILSIHPGEADRDYSARVICDDELRLPIVIRLDGVSFSKALRGFQWPRDPRVHGALVEVSRRVMRHLAATYALVISDELNILVQNYLPYGGRCYKLITTVAGMASATMSILLGRELYFDARIVEVKDNCDAARYMLYRVRVGFNNYHIETLQSSGDIPRDRTPSLREMLKIKAEISWRTVGTLLTRETREIQCVDKRSGETRRCLRRVIREITLDEFIESACPELRGRLSPGSTH